MRARPGRRKCLKGVDVDPPGEILSMSEQNCGTERRIMVVLIIRARQPHVCFRIDAVVDVGAIDADENDLPAPLDGHLGG
jgi:hypothetical protein